VQSPQTPGVYYERVDASAPAISPLRTDIAGFVGIATRGPLHQPLPVQSWRQFQAYFGDFTGAGYLAYAVRAFFENGGQRCWVVRVAAETAATAARHCSRQAWPTFGTFRHPVPVWGNDLDIVIRETHRAQTVTVPQASAPEFSTVVSTTGFGRGTQVRLSQGATRIHKVISDVDVIGHRLLWVNPKAAGRAPGPGSRP
jgi:phage tail sheath protein FI